MTKASCVAALAMGAALSGTAATAANAQAMTTPAPPPAVAQATGPAAELQRAYAAVKANILKSADRMPPETFAYKPEPDIRTFARVLNHVTEAQLRSCGAANGTAADALAKVPAETADKPTIIAALNASFAECDKAYATLTDAKITETLSLGKQTRSRIGLLWANISHDNEQYAALALYLRLKGIAPPSTEK